MLHIGVRGRGGMPPRPGPAGPRQQIGMPLEVPEMGKDDYLASMRNNLNGRIGSVGNLDVTFLNGTSRVINTSLAVADQHPEKCLLRLLKDMDAKVLKSALKKIKGTNRMPGRYRALARLLYRDSFMHIAAVKSKILMVENVLVGATEFITATQYMGEDTYTNWKMLKKDISKLAKKKTRGALLQLGASRATSAAASAASASGAPGAPHAGVVAAPMQVDGDDDDDEDDDDDDDDEDEDDDDI